MANETDPIEILDATECWRLLRTSDIARLAVSVSGQPDIFPLNYVVDGERLLFRTAQGTKLVHVLVNERVALEVDGIHSDEVWSVVVKGTARILDDQSEIDAADRLPLRPLAPTLKYVYVEVTPHELTGRRFVPGPEPERYWHPLPSI